MQVKGKRPAPQQKVKPLVDPTKPRMLGGKFPERFICRCRRINMYYYIQKQEEAKIQAQKDIEKQLKVMPLKEL